MTRIATTVDIERLDFAKSNGLVTVVAQDALTGAVLMVAHADREALERSLATGEMHYCSRTRGLWHKGSTSGSVQRIESLTADCDGDSVLARVISAGPACHTGAATCFGDDRRMAAAQVLATLSDTIAERAAAADATPSYTRKLLGDRNLRLKKIGEEASELVLACADEDRARAAEEAADLLYHALVALRALGADLGNVAEVLLARQR